MRTKYLLFGAIFTIFGLVARGQVYQMYYQGFESGETQKFEVSSPTNYSFETALASGGSQCLKLVQSNIGSIEMITDTIDFTQNTSLQFIALEFDHINNISAVSSASANVGQVWVKLTQQGQQWQLLTSNYYNTTEGTYSQAFQGMAAFNLLSYPGVWNQNPLTNDCWRHERFDFTTLFNNVPNNERKVMFKFVLERRTSTSANTQAWWIDNLQVRASQNEMKRPLISMVSYPDGNGYPNSRGATIVLDARTTVAQGINPDSVCLYYTVGSDLTPNRIFMSQTGTYTDHTANHNVWRRFSGRIPFDGYDTVMRFYCVVKDSSTNANEATFPSAADSWITYRYIRGTEQSGVPTPSGFNGTQNTSNTSFPFPNKADNRTEWIFDSALMYSAGYGPGAITEMRFKAGAALTAAKTLTDFQIRMKNMPTSYTQTANVDEPDFMNDYMKVVYDGNLQIAALASGDEFTIQFQDTFYYSGGDLLVQTMYNNSTDGAAVVVKTISAPNNKKTIYRSLGASYQANPYSDNDYLRAINNSNTRPAAVLKEHRNMPLLHDMGVSKILYPNDQNTVMSVPTYVSVRLNNYGAYAINAVRITYAVDDTLFGHYDWTGPLAAGDSVVVTIENNLDLPAGFHYMRVWVEDTLTAGGALYRDHEPLNDSSYAEFIVCDGALSGVRQIGGAEADYNTIEEFLFSLSRCGMDGSLVVKLAPGEYAPFVLPQPNGHSRENYIRFESLDPANRAVLYADATTNANYIIDITALSDVRFVNIDFERRGGVLTNMVGLGSNSQRCLFDGCSFKDLLASPTQAQRIPAMLSNSQADSITIVNCYFEGGTVGVKLIGVSDSVRNTGNVVSNNTFRNQYNSAVDVQYQTAALVDHNEMYDVLTTASAILAARASYGNTRLTGNKIFTSHGATALEATTLHGTATSHAIVANNMIVCDDDGTATQLATPLSVTGGEWTDVVYNSIKMTASSRSNVATATFGLGAVNSRFMNNIVASFSTNNYALSYMPSGQTTLQVGHNIYYSAGGVLNRRQGSQYPTILQWRQVEPADTASLAMNPDFLNGSLMDLRSFKRQIVGVGYPIPEVTVDMYNTVRGVDSTCPGAYEFSALLYDFETQAVLSPISDVCDMPDSVDLVLRIMNNGIANFTAESGVTFRLAYRINNGAVDTLTITDSIPAEGSADINTGVRLSLPPNGIHDVNYNIAMWVICTSDPNETNDTLNYQVVSRYHPAAPANVTHSTTYMNPTTVNITEGVDLWNVYQDTTTTKYPSVIYWYYNADDDTAFYKGNSLTTGILRHDTSFFISQHRELPIVRITQIMFNGTVGQQSQRPSWMKSDTKFAVQLTNIGDDTAFLQGDTLRVVATTPNGSINNKNAVFANVFIAPGKSLVVQFNSGTSSNTEATVYSGSKITPSADANIGIVYRHNGMAADAVALNSIIATAPPATQSVKWSSQNVPSYVWDGDALQMSAANVGGIIRTGFDGGAADWMEASASNPIAIDVTNPNWIRYADNGCRGELATVNLVISNPPTTDIDLVAQPINEGCGLGNETVSVRVRNFGDSAIVGMQLNYTIGGADTVHEFLADSLPSGGDTLYQFAQALNLAFDRDSLVNVLIWATSRDDDPQHDNDTTSITTLSLFTPGMPDIPSDDTSYYACPDTITIADVAGRLPVWYDMDGTPVDTGMTHITEALYAQGQIGVSYIATTAVNGRIGTSDNTITGKNAYPSPYQPKNKNVKQQFIYTVDELEQVGVTRGYIRMIAFHLDSIFGTVGSLEYKNFNIAIGTTADANFGNASAWKSTEVVYSRSTMNLYRSSSRQWVWHTFDKPYYWDGESNIVVQVSFENDAAFTTGLQTAYTTTSQPRALYKAQDNVLQPSALEYEGAGSTDTKRPNIMFASSNFGCEGPIKNVNIHLIGIPDNDATIDWPAGADTTSYTTCSNVQPPIIVRNYGNTVIDSVNLLYYLDGAEEPDTTVHTTNILSGGNASLQLFDRPLMPGRHSVKVVVSVAGDTITNNDTIIGTILVRFCGGSYLVASDSTGDFLSLKAAVDTLNNVGIVGPVVVRLKPGVYHEQVSLDSVYGSSPVNTITFIGQTVDSVGAVLIGNTTVASNYVFRLNGVSNVVIDSLTMISRPLATGVKAAKVLVLNGAENVVLRNSTLRAKQGISDTAAACIALAEGCNGLLIVDNVLDSGSCAIITKASDEQYRSLNIIDNTISNFLKHAINISDVTVLNISSNDIRSGASGEVKGLFVSNVDSTITIQKNSIYLIDGQSGKKWGMHLVNIIGCGLDGGYIVNNMVGTNAAGAQGSGIYVDGNSTNLNILYNTVRVYAGATETSTKAFYSGANTSDLRVMNNIFANLSKSYAYYVTNGNSVTSSDHNGYYNNGTNKLAYWNADRNNLVALRTANQKDANSVQDEPYFTAVDDLHMLMTNFCKLAQPNADVTDDIDGKPRSSSEPTIGAQEIDRMSHNMTVVRITSPRMPANISSPINIESDSILVSAAFFNNGDSSESNVQWYAYIEGYETQTRSVTHTLGTFASSEMKKDSLYIHPPLGIIETHTVKVVLVSNLDDDTTDNELTAPVYLAPAFNLKAVKVQISGTTCNMSNATVSITLKNEGAKDMPSGTSFDISYTLDAYHPTFLAQYPDSNKLYFPTMPVGVITENYTLERAVTRTGSNSQITIDFATHPNLYPTDTSLNIKISGRGWVSYQFDITNDNDTVAVTTADSYYRPRPPQGHDTTLAYGTWGEVTASQNMGNVIRWYSDTNASFFHPANSQVSSTAANYNISTRWSTTPRYMSNKTYYLRCVSDKQCTSAFSPVTVSVAARLPKDMAVEEVLAPLGHRVYMENDTVRVRIANYGTTAASNVPVTYQVRSAANTAPIQQVTQICPANIAPGQSMVFTFDTLVNIPSPTLQKDYYVRVWTDLANDQSRRNDTIRTVEQLRPAQPNNVTLDYKFSTYAETKYPSRNNSSTLAEDEVDFVRFSFNGIDIDLPPMGRTYTDFGYFSSPEIPPLHVSRGLKDTVYMMITNPADEAAVERGKVALYIDFNRNGSFTDSGECVIPSTNLYNNTLFASEITIPTTASIGYMKMRAVACNNSANPTSNLGNNKGHFLDFLLFVDKESAATDIAIQKIITPRSYLVKTDDSTVVTFRMCNRGRQAVTDMDIYYNFDAETFDSANSGSFHWTGNLQPGASTNVSLPAHVFGLGTTTLYIWHTINGDADRSNDTLVYEYHRFHTLTLTVDDNFDSMNYWYAPVGYNNYTHNYWELGTPNKSKLRRAYTAPNAWTTDLTATVATGKRGNVSYLYSPLINISQIKPDSLFFYLARNLGGTSSLHLEYYDYNNNWVKVASDTGTSTTWYNDDEKAIFSGTDTHFVRKAFRTSEISGNFQQMLQFRFVYKTPQSSNATASYGDGCVIDNFRIARAQRSVDHGAIAITQPVSPQYGQTIYPTIVVKNYGLDTLRNVTVGYTHYGTNLAKISTFSCNIPPLGGIDTFQMTTPFVITSSFPDTFSIKAFTVSPADVYKDNDSVSRQYILQPLDNDISAVDFVSPFDNVIAGDSISVTMRVHNFGRSSISNARFSYILNDNLRYDEDVVFDPPLLSKEYRNYTFNHRFRASMGVMRIVGIVKCDSNDYIYNDTISKLFSGISSITDIAASSIVLDQSSGTSVKVQLVVENRGARGANDFEVGFYVDGDTANVYRETFHAHNILPALTTGYHVFEQTLPVRATPYDNITAFVSAPDDYDRSNDTTTAIVEPFADMEAVAVVIEENARPDCRVFMRVRNVGNVTTAGRQLRLTATVNGNTVEYSTGNRRINPGSEVLIPIQRTIPKDPNRHYTGTGTVELAGDTVVVNNQTSQVVVVNYVEGVPTVADGQFVLEQNYPNPFSGRTTIPFTLSEASNVRFFVMDATGHMVYSTTGYYPAGDAHLLLDMSSFPAGVYYYGIEAPAGRLMRKMILR